MKTSKKYFQKLVRDNAPQNIEVSGRKPAFRYLSSEERRDALRKKLNEEINELQMARTPEELLEEAADVYEVLLAFVNQAGFLDADLDAKVKQKRRHCGSYNKFVWLESVESP